MSLRSSCVVLGLVTLLLTSVPAQDRFMPIDEIRPGMIGIGRTVFEGEQVQEFKVHVLGVLRNVSGPRRNLILARLEGGPLADTGVIAGMSGSPVYIDGRLIGAVGYSLGAFSKEPIGGITPIAEMIEAAGLDAPRARIARQPKVQLPVTHETMASALRQAFSWMRPFADRPGDVQVTGGRLDGAVATMLRPIATPLVMGGFDPSVADMLMSAFGSSGFVPVVGGATGSQQAAAGPTAGGKPTLRPGDAVGVTLIGGDLSLGATGTVTHVDGDRVYAFGHPFYNIGPTRFPMTRAFVHALLPSLSSSMKISTTGEVIGTFQQDRATAIAGTLGKGPKMIPVRMTLEADRGLQKTLAFEVVNDQLFTPLLTYTAILNTLSAYERQYGASSFMVTGKARVGSHGEVAFEDLFTGDDSPSVGAAAYVAGPITFLLSNDFEPIEIEGVDLTIKTSEQPRTAKLERVWLDTARPRAGRTVPLKVLWRTYRGEEVVRTIPIDIPAHARGRLTVLVTDGSRLAQWEQREMQRPLEPRGIPQLMRALNKAHKNNRLYVKLLSSDAGAVVEGEILSALPPSVLAVFEADRNGGSFVPVGSSTLGEWEIATDNVVTGSRQLSITVDVDGDE